MAITISWTKSWSASDDGTTLGGGDLGNIQSDIEAHSHTSGIDTLVALSDTPANYTAKGLYFAGVNSGANAIEFVKIKRSVVWFIPDPYITDSASAKVRLPFAGTAVRVQAYGSPTGGAFTVQIQKNGTDMLTTALSIAADQSAGDTSTFDVSAITAGDYLEVDVDAVNNANNVTIIMDIETGTT